MSITADQSPSTDEDISKNSPSYASFENTEILANKHSHSTVDGSPYDNEPPLVVKKLSHQILHKVSNQSKKKASVSARTTLPFHTLEDETQFWATYAKEAGEHDREMLDKWNKTLDVLLIFAALFSAINTAFIVESYRGLQPDPSENTTRLLSLLLIHRNDNIEFSEASLASLLASQASPSATPVNSIFFASLSCSLMAAFGAMLAKQWLTEYATSGRMLPLHTQGRRRQERYTGLVQWRFWILMELLPMLLQLSLLLFLIGVIYFLWSSSHAVALVVLGLTVLGLGVYTITIIVAIMDPMAPFQTPISNALRQPIFSTLGLITSSLSKTTQGKSSTKISTPPMQLFPRIAQWISTSPPSDGNEEDGIQIPEEHHTTNVKCALWLIEQAEHPQVTLSALNALPRLPPDLLLSLFKRKEGLFERLIRFHCSLISAGDERRPHTWPNGTIVSGAALLHILKAANSGETRLFKSSPMNPLSASAPSLEIPDPLPTTSMEITKLFIPLCLRLQESISMPIIDTLISLLHQVSPSFNVQHQVAVVDRSHGLSSQSLVTSISLISLFLDTMIICATAGSKLKHHSGLGSQIYSKHFEPVYAFLLSVLETYPPVDVISHIALTVAAVQWYGRDPHLDKGKEGNVYPEGFQGSLNSGLYAADKSKTVMYNVGLAFCVSDLTKLNHVGSIYQALLSFAEAHFFRDIHAPSYSYFGQGLLRFGLKNSRNTETLTDVLYVMRRLSNDSWISAYLRGEYAAMLSTLLNIQLQSAFATYNYAARASAAGMLDRLASGLPDNKQFVSMLLSERVHKRNKALSRYLCDSNLIRRGYGMACSSRIWLMNPIGDYAAALVDLQLEMTMATLRPHAPRFVACVAHFFNTLMEEDESLHWPAYFISAGIISHRDGRHDSVDLKRIEKSDLTALRYDPPRYALWKGEALLMMWTRALTEFTRGRLPDDWDDRSFFADDSIIIIFEYLSAVQDQCIIGFNASAAKQYLRLALGNVNDGRLISGIQSRLDVLDKQG
ncbi:hypothetical protein FRC02_011315 [Tulasnella sp. 418]|nr:hypothetical protein FRC02_011315 [Tulasnella sp. 418]